MADLHLAVLDAQGRLWLRQPALLLGWMPGIQLAITVEDGMVRLGDGPGQAVDVGATVDNRYRIQVPFGLRAMIGFRPGVRVLVVTLPAEGSVAVLPVDRVVAALTRNR
jgi:hypothetical protein